MSDAPRYRCRSCGNGMFAPFRPCQMCGGTVWESVPTSVATMGIDDRHTIYVGLERAVNEPGPASSITRR